MTQAATLAQLASSGALSADTSGNVTAGGTMTATNLFAQGQTWQNVAASRAVATTYTNTTGRPIFVVAALNSTTTCSLFLTINSILSYGSSTGSVGFIISVSFVVPIGGTYSVTLNAGSPTIGTWTELR